MCCGANPNWGAKANATKSLGAAVMTFGILTCIGFIVGGWLSGIAGILALVASSLILCCGPPQTGPGMGGKFKAAAILSFVAALLHLIGAILMLLVIVAANSVDSQCIDALCSGSTWSSNFCSDTQTICSSEAQCREHASGIEFCEGAGDAVSALAGIILWPAIILALASMALELAFGVKTWKAVPEMEGKAGGV
jgi:hypothetical protein